MSKELINTLWVEKYRPKSVQECILSENIKNTFQQFINKGDIPNFIFSGTAGVGKTSVAKAICNEVGADYLFINASDENGIDTLRTKIKSFASTISLIDANKVVILDEADALTGAVQQALRSFTEEYSANCRYIYTCNVKSKLIEPLHSRCAVIDFKIESKDKPILAEQFFKRVLTILDLENVKYEKKVVAELVQKYFPDFRRTLNELQRYSVNGEINSGILSNYSLDSFKELIQFLKKKEYSKVRNWVAKNSDVDCTQLFRDFYDNCQIYFENVSIPQLILILGEYSYRNSFVADSEINVMAAMTEIMSNCQLK